MHIYIYYLITAVESYVILLCNKHSLFISALSSGAIAVTTGRFSEVTVPIIFSNVNCSGSESSLRDCPHSAGSQAQCDANEDAATVCQGKQFYIICVRT